MAKILLVEDDEYIKRMLSMRLGLQGHEIDQAGNGQQAVDMAISGLYDLILMDMHMPVMDGHQATRMLREKGYDGLIVAVTASVMSADSEKAIQSGCNDYIAKPISDDFEDQVKTLLAQH